MINLMENTYSSGNVTSTSYINYGVDRCIADCYIGNHSNSKESDVSKEMMDKMMEAHRIALALSRTLVRETKDPNDSIRASCLLFVSSCLNADWDIEESRMNELTHAALMMARKGREEWIKSENLQ